MGLEIDTREQGAEAVETSEPVPSAALPTYTTVLLVCIGVVFVTQFLTSEDPQFVAVDRFSAYYAGFDKEAFRNGEYWRALTGALVHSGILHLGMNCYALFALGRLIELLSNRAHVAIVFVLAALGGDFLSLVFSPEGRSVGASGGIVGLLSYLAVYAFRRRRFVSARFRRSLVFNIGFLLILGIVLQGVVDNYGHIGGLIVGALYAWIQIPSDEYVDPRLASSLTRIAGVASIILVVLTTILTVLLLINGAAQQANA